MPYHQNAVILTRYTIYVGLAQACPNKLYEASPGCVMNRSCKNKIYYIDAWWLKRVTHSHTRKAVVKQRAAPVMRMLLVEMQNPLW